MSQQFHNGGRHDGNITWSFRDSAQYAVVNPPFCGKHRKPGAVQKQTDRARRARDSSAGGQTVEARKQRSASLAAASYRLSALGGKRR